MLRFIGNDSLFRDSSYRNTFNILVNIKYIKSDVFFIDTVIYVDKIAICATVLCKRKWNLSSNYIYISLSWGNLYMLYFIECKYPSFEKFKKYHRMI